MKRLILVIELEYDDEIMHGESEEEVGRFKDMLLSARHDSEEGSLILHSNYIGDEVGTVRVMEVKDV